MNFNTHARRMVVLLLAIALTVGSAGLPSAASAPLDTTQYPNNTAETVSVDDRNQNNITVSEDGASVEIKVVDQSTHMISPFDSYRGADQMALRIAPHGADVRLLDVTWNASNAQGSWRASNPTDGDYICIGVDDFVSTYDWCDIEDGTVTSYTFDTSNSGTAIADNGGDGYSVRHLDEYEDWQGTFDVEYLLNGERKSVSLAVNGDWDDDRRGNHPDKYPFTQPRIVDVVPVSAYDTVSSVTLNAQTVADVDAVYDGQSSDDGAPRTDHLNPSDEYSIMFSNDIPGTTQEFENSFGDNVYVVQDQMMFYNSSVDIPRSDWLDVSQIDNSDTRYMVVYAQGHGIYEDIELSYQDNSQEFVLPVNRSEGTPASVDVELAGGESEIETHVFNSSSEEWTVLGTTTTTNASISYDIPAEYRESPYSDFRVVVRGDGATGTSLSYAPDSGTDSGTDSGADSSTDSGTDSDAGSGSGAGPGDDIPSWVWVLIALVVVAGVAYRSYRDDGDDMEFSPRT